MKGMYQWLGTHVHAWYGTLIFGLLVVIEGFFIVPVSTLLAFYSLENRKRAFTYALIATLMSAVGALVGYALGMLLWQAGGATVIHYFITPEKFDAMVDQFKNYQAWTTFAVALTPMPFKILTLTAGFCKLPILTFVGLSMLARGLRFFAIATAIVIWGEQVHYIVNKYFYTVVAVCVALFVALWYFVH